MTQSIQVLCLGLAIFFLSCSKDNEVSVEAQLSGSWKAIEVYTNNGQSSGTANGITINSTYTFEGKDINTIVTFNDDHTFSSVGSYTQVLKTTLNGETFITEFEANDFVLPGTWEATETSITFKQATGEVQTAEIITLTDEKLEFKYEFSNTEITPDFTTLTSATIFYTLKKE